MINDNNKNEIIEQYFLGKLNRELLEEFMHRLTTDEEFKAEVALEQALYKNLKVVGREEQRLKLEIFHKELGHYASKDEPEEQNKAKNFGKIIKLPIKKFSLMAAASIALIIGSTFIYNTISNKSVSHETIFATSFIPYPIEVITRGDLVKESIKEQAFAAYNEGGFQKSVKLFSALPESEQDEMTMFFLGNAYLSANMPYEAIDTFKKYLLQYEEFEIEAKWYLSLAYLKVGEETAAKQLLEQLASADDPQAGEYKEKAKEILNKL